MQDREKLNKLDMLINLKKFYVPFFVQHRTYYIGVCVHLTNKYREITGIDELVLLPLLHRCTCI